MSPVAVRRSAAEEVIEGDFVQRRGRGEGRDVAADAFLHLVGAHDHRHRVPADDALDAAFDLVVAGKRRLAVGGDGVDVGRGRGEREFDTGALTLKLELLDQASDTFGAAGLQHVFEGFKPFAIF